MLRRGVGQAKRRAIGNRKGGWRGSGGGATGNGERTGLHAEGAGEGDVRAAQDQGRSSAILGEVRDAASDVRADGDASRSVAIIDDFAGIVHSRTRKDDQASARGRTIVFDRDVLARSGAGREPAGKIRVPGAHSGLG